MTIVEPTREQIERFATDLRTLAYSRHPLKSLATGLHEQLTACAPSDQARQLEIARTAGTHLAQVWLSLAYLVSTTSPLGVVLGLGAVEARTTPAVRDLYDVIVSTYAEAGAPYGSVAAGGVGLWLDREPERAAMAVVGAVAVLLRLGVEADAADEQLRAERRAPPAMSARRGPFFPRG